MCIVTLTNVLVIKVKVKWSRYRPGVAHRVGRGIALLFHDRGNRRGWGVCSTPRSHFTPGKDTVPILQEAECAPGPVWTGGKSRPHRNSIPDRPAPNSVTRLAELPGPQLSCNRNVKVKVKFNQEQDMKAQWGSRCIALLFLQPRR